MKKTILLTVIMLLIGVTTVYAEKGNPIKPRLPLGQVYDLETQVKPFSVENSVLAANWRREIISKVNAELISKGKGFTVDEKSMYWIIENTQYIHTTRANFTNTNEINSALYPFQDFGLDDDVAYFVYEGCMVALFRGSCMNPVVIPAENTTAYTPTHAPVAPASAPAAPAAVNVSVTNNNDNYNYNDNSSGNPGGYEPSYQGDGYVNNNSGPSFEFNSYDDYPTFRFRTRWQFQNYCQQNDWQCGQSYQPPMIFNSGGNTYNYYDGTQPYVAPIITYDRGSRVTQGGHDDRNGRSTTNGGHDDRNGRSTTNGGHGDDTYTRTTNGGHTDNSGTTTYSNNRNPRSGNSNSVNTTNGFTYRQTPVKTSSRSTTSFNTNNKSSGGSGRQQSGRSQGGRRR